LDVECAITASSAGRGRRPGTLRCRW
jgi:hypothetical protein